MLELTFITSSRIKKEHALYLCRDYYVNIASKKYYGKGYDEPRIHERDELLKKSIEDALIRWKRNVNNPDEKLFFIEDTSVIIHALSRDEVEVPGVDIKYWMQENSFNDIDEKLKAHGDDRRVTVRSDVLLVLSSSMKKDDTQTYVRFTSEVNGTIVDHEFEVSTNPVYPWLDNKTFNKWFVPDGCIVPISMLNIAEADQHDFRSGAFNDMLKFLAENNKILRKDDTSFPLMAQAGLPIGHPLFIVSGPTCSGKTTLADFAVKKYGYYHIEASDFMYLRYFQKLGIGSSITISDFAKQALIEKPDIVVDEILKYIELLQDCPIIVTGFRTLNEVRSFEENYKGSYRIEIIIINADENVRLKRYLDRDRGGETTSGKFYRDCKTQNEMGLRDLMKAMDANVILNNILLYDFFNEFVIRYKNDLFNVYSDMSQDASKARPTALEDAILMAMLINDSNFLTTAEIAKLINKTFFDMKISKSKNNVSRYFNQEFHPFYEAKKDGGINKYRLSQTGRMHAQWLSFRRK